MRPNARASSPRSSLRADTLAMASSSAGSPSRTLAAAAVNVVTSFR
jgi:hypothetical protein